MSSMTADTVRRIEREAATTRISQEAAYLQNAFGQRFVAYLAGVNDARMVGRWARGEHPPRDIREHRLRVAYEVTKLLSEAYDTETAKAWLMGSNSRLDGEAPAYLLRHAEQIDDTRLIVPTARAFAGGAV